MQIRLRPDHVLVISPSLVRLFGLISTGSSEAKGAAFFPIIFVKSEEYVQPWLINHERIHFRQQLETLFLGGLVVTLLERLYARLFLGKNKMERYLYAATEQEAYLNMCDPDYLRKRPLWSLFRHVRSKRKFRLTGPGEVEFLD